MLPWLSLLFFSLWCLFLVLPRLPMFETTGNLMNYIGRVCHTTWREALFVTMADNSSHCRSSACIKVPTLYSGGREERRQV